MVRSGKALPFVVATQEEFRVRLFLDPNSLANIEDTYQVAAPIVVMAIIGPQGQGKSTLLNSITQFCTETVQLPTIFKMGNTGEHTTKGSQVLSHPLYYKEQQIMLVDLEGLGGIETEDVTKGVLQQNLIAALLTVASVPCIMVDNTTKSKVFMEKTIATIAKLQRDVGFLTERVHVLFHDKDIGAEESKEFVSLVRDLNGEHFEGNPVIKMLNKPNFVAAQSNPQRELFLKTLLDDSLYIKQNMQQIPENLKYLLNLINVIGSHPSTNFRPVQLDLDEVSNIDEFVKPILKRIVEIQKTTDSEDDKRLLHYFNEEINSFIQLIETDLQAKNPAFREQCKKRIKLELKQKKEEIRAIEECYDFIRLATRDEMKQKIEALVKYCYDVEKLKTILNQVHLHFRKSRPIIDDIFETLDSNVSFYTNLSIAISTGRVISTAAEVAILGLPRVALTRVTTKVARSTILPDLGVLCEGILGTTSYSVGRVVELVLKNGKVNEEVFKDIRANEEHPHLRPEAKAPVMLFLGSETTLFWEFANTFAKSLSLFVSAGSEAFRSSQPTQLLHFDYEHPGLGDILARCYLICLRLENNTSNDRMIKLAERLIPTASVTFLLVDDPSHYALPLLRALPQAMNTHLVVVHKSEVNRGGMLRELKRVGSKYSMKEVEEYNKEQIEAIRREIAEDFDRSSAQECRKFRGNLVSLALDQVALELIYINSMWGNNTLNETALKAISVAEEPPHLHLDANGPVLLFLGSKTTLFWQFANALVRRIAPLTPTEFEAFSPDKYTQILPFDYTHPDLGDTLTRSCIVCLRMKKKPASNYYHAMMNIAKKLIPTASLTCLLVDNPAHYAQPLLNSQSSTESPMTIHKIMIIRGTETIGKLKMTLTQRMVNYEEKQVQRFASEEINARIEEIKGGWDRAEVQKYGYLKSQADLLPAVLG